MIKAKSKYAWVQYHPEGSPHSHMVVLGDGRVLLTEIEEAAEELAEAVLRCNDMRHKGHGHSHSQQEADKAYYAAIDQLTTKVFYTEWHEMMRQIRIYKKWGGPPPAAVLMPSFDNPREWEAMIPDTEGNPYMYKMNKQVLEDIVPYPSDWGAKPNKQGVGWTLDRRRKYGVHSRMNRALKKARR